MIEPRRWFSLCLRIFVLAAVAAPIATSVSRAAELIPPRTTDRKYPQGVFCPLPLELSFVADGPTATLRFSTTTVNYFDSNNGNTWAQQRLDNICVASDADYQAHLGTLASTWSGCYIDPGPHISTTFYFQDASGIPLKETFSADPALSGWDLSGGAYWEQNDSAPNNPGLDGSDSSTGCLGLGAFTPAASLSDSAYTTRVVSGLTAGTTYWLTGWWDVESMLLNKVFLTVAVLGNDAVPVTRKTWGALKRAYR